MLSERDPGPLRLSEPWNSLPVGTGFYQWMHFHAGYSGAPQEGLRPRGSPSGTTGGIRVFPIPPPPPRYSPPRTPHVPLVPLTLTFLTKQAPYPLLIS